MRKFIAPLMVAVLGFSVIGYGFAKSQPKPPPGIPQIELYAAPNADVIVKKLPFGSPFVAFFQQGDWVKIGLPSDGSVAWINKDQYQQAEMAYYRPNVQTAYVYTQQQKGQKPTVSVVAYRNGKPVKGKQADELYQQITREQARRWQHMQRLEYRMNRLFDDTFFAPFGASPSVWRPQPMVIVHDNR